MKIDIEEDDVIRIVLRNDYKYKGKVLSVNDSFLKMRDDKTGREVVINAAEISNYEVLGG